MGHLLSVIKLLWVQRSTSRYLRSKEIAIAMSQKQKPAVSVIDYFYYWWAKYCACGCIKSYFRANLNNRLTIKFLLLYNRMTTSGTFSNYIATAILGFIGGVFLTFVYFSVVAVIIDLSIASAFYVSVGLCIFLTIGLSFFESVRCVTLSVLPEICTRKARSMLISYALVLMIAGPGSNILYNTRQLTETITCTREQMHSLTHNLTELYMKPLRALKNGIENLIQNIRPVIQAIKSGINSVKDAVMSVVEAIKSAVSWLGAFSSICNNEIGTPYEMCYRYIEKTVQDCLVKVFFPFQFACEMGTIIQKTCYTFKIADVFCQFIPFVKNEIFTFVKDKVKGIGRFVKTIFYVSVSFHHSFAFQTNQSKTTAKVLRDVFHAEEARLKHFFHILDFMKLALGAYILYVLLSTFVYRQRFFKVLWYDNYHINKYIIELDLKRASVNRQTLFPLTLGEKMYYVSLFSFRLTVTEQQNILRDSFFLLLSAVKVFFLLLIDYTLHWILTLINRHARIQFYFGNDQTKVTAEGSGLWFTVYNIISSLVKPFDVEFRFNTQSCLPEPIPPAYHIYERVAYIIGFAWMMVIFQPFGQRFRNYVMSQYYPQAARKRAIFLYNYILQSRGNISLYIRRQVFRKVAFGLRTDKPNFRKWLLMKFPRLKYFLPYKDMMKECMICGYTKPTVYCITPECPGTYCKDCFKQIKEVCMLCNMPQDYHGSNVSEEEDSEDEVESQSIIVDASIPRRRCWENLSNTQNELIELQDLEEARLPIGKIEYLQNNADTETKDYFDESWRKDHWACLDDFLIPLPDFKKWIRPELQEISSG